jgi:uncharacterized circularly permuted ATP-grasp superfamily protein
VPRPGDCPVVAVLTPGLSNSAHFAHSYLAQQMGADLVEGSDLVVGHDDGAYMKPIDGLRSVLRSTDPRRATLANGSPLDTAATGRIRPAGVIGAFL